jgi:amino acid adenylation domain-containing protein/thioester reductase-like protein
VVECASILVDRGWRVCGVVTGDPLVRALAAGRGFLTHDFGELTAGLTVEPCDVLFSVANLRMLPAETLVLPRRMAVNFHDALLPRSAGVNATAWAIAERATEHGVSWHVMTAEADAGDILAQRSFPVSREDTSWTLNQKCWHAALESFGVLAEELAAGQEQRLSQDATLRTYHGRLDRPGLALSWWRSAADLAALVRACEFGTSPNRFGLCRVLTPAGWLMVSRARAEDSSGTVPGTVVATADTGFTVATSAGALRLETGPHGVTPGMLLPEPGTDAAEAERLGLAHEPFWRRRLGELRPLRGLCGYGPPISVTAPGSPDDILTAVLAYLGALSGEDVFDIGLRTAAHPLLTTTIPLRPGQTVRTPYLRDLLLRQSSLSTVDLPVVVEFGQDPAPASAAELLIQIGERSCTWFSDNPALAEGFAAFAAALPDAGADQAPLISPDESKRLACRNDTRSGSPLACVHDMVAEQARKRPEATAIVSGEHRLTYRDLEERVAALAAHLAARGAGPGERIAVYLERSADLPVALLAVLRSGAAYVPVDPVYPAERISYMIADADVALVVTHSSLARNVPGAPRVLLDHDVLSGATPPAGVPTRDDLAYVIYTSGSTGRPKGVQITHGALTNFLSSMAARPGCTAADTLLAVTTACFDIAALELFLPLVTGGIVHVAPPGAAGDGATLRDLLTDSGATILQATPVTWRLLIDAGWTGDPGLKVLCGGEAMPQDLASALLKRAGQVWNMYGPTETTIWSTVSRVRHGERVTIGTPIANTTCHVLDGYLRPVPAGIAGELFIGGDGLATGYRDRPELTTQRFLETPHGRLYRTGDLARWRGDGTLECLGRTDHQIKLHGHRIEPGEIEAVLRESPAVHDAVVVVRDDRLIGYLAPAGQDMTALRSSLRSRLPRYMVPAALIELAELPKTPNGKIDRKALPDDGPRPQRTPDETERPTTLHDLIESVCAHTADILDTMEPVTADQAFSDLGIDSLAGVALLDRLRTTTGVRLSVTAIFQHPTSRALAARLHQTSLGATSPDQRPDLTTLRLPDDIGAPPVTSAWGTGPCLVTGATGFFGAFLTRELALRGRTVHCLVRAADPVQAKRRLYDTLTAYELWDDALVPHLVAQPGDLTQPLLGLSEHVWADLAATSNDIYHCGAHVSAIHPYGALAAANVTGTQEALRLVARSGAFLHHISSIEVFAAPPSHGGLITPADPPGPPQQLRGGYAQTKYAAEQLVAQASGRGLPTAVYRLPRILGDTRTGAGQTRDLLWQVLKGCVIAQTAPANLDATYDLTPVDYAARCIATTTPEPGTILHLTNPARVRLGTLIAYLRAAGYPLTPQPLDAWSDQIRDTPDNPATAVLDVFLAEMTGTGWSRLAFASTYPDCPPLDEATFARYLDHYTRTGYLPKPG